MAQRAVEQNFTQYSWDAGKVHRDLDEVVPEGKEVT